MITHLGAAAEEEEEEGLNRDKGCGAFPGSRGLGLDWAAPSPGEDSSTPPRTSETTGPVPERLQPRGGNGGAG